MVAVEPAPPACMPNLTLVSGSARSGKSRWAEHLARTSGASVVLLATGPRSLDDPDWRRRVDLHRRRRPNHWQTWEVEAQLVPALKRLEHGQLGLVDSIGTWVAALIAADPSDWNRHCDALIDGCGSCRAPLVLVCEETGWGVVPPTAIGGLFRDRLGVLQQRLCQVADSSWLVTAGRALDLMALSQPVPP